MPESEPVRLARRVAELARCSRREAEQYIAGGWVRVDGEVVEEPQHTITTQVVEVAGDARLESAEPATMLLHKSAAHESAAAPALIAPGTHADGDASGVRLLQRHFQHLTPLMPLEAEASGLMVLSQDGRVRRRLTEDGDAIEQEYVVEVSGNDPGPYALSRLSRGMSYRGRPLPPCKVSWQNETRLRFAIKAVRPGQLRDMCAQVGFEVISIRRIRIGRVAMGKLPLGQWRYLPVSERF
ncbi:RNA pseudouridine synthase [Lysobacter sp. D1-1-M9]|uniref:RNA pseudouridine synthase n=1 Tax=Novilysobacter longmucuonensis TaxID=3098603 RepID=UPI002FC909EB